VSFATLRRNLTRDNGRSLLRHALATALVSSLGAIAYVTVGGSAWAPTFVYSLSIGMISWLVIDLGQLGFSRDPTKLWPYDVKRVVLVAAGMTVGFLAGNAIGDAYLGVPLLEFWTYMPRKLASSLFVTTVVGGAILYFFYSRGKSQYLERGIALAQRDATEARLKLLEAQLEPHMLFNTLANLRALITIDPPRAVAMLDRLHSYLRVTLSGSRSLAHPLSAEFDRLGDYLELMSVRMGPRLSYTLDLPSDLREVPVPPLMLQPLVENSVRHGLEPQVEGGAITVRARRDGEQLVVEVSDTGVGMTPGAAPSEGGFGLAQVRERLATLYGARSAMVLTARAGGGTCAAITFPLPPT